jgi:3-hydroxyacyl-[acyl-carrier-protein] dehydratase
MLDKDGIKKIIPHREPFLLIDEVLELAPGESVLARRKVSEDEYYFEGHFPQEKIMPGVLIVEAIAQAGAVCVLSMPENKGKLAYFGGIKNAKFRGKVAPGDELELALSVETLRKNVGYGKGAAYKIVDGKRESKPVCLCEISFALGS